MYKERAHFIEELNTFIGSAKAKYNSLLQTLNWTRESLLTSKEIEIESGQYNLEHNKYALANSDTLKDEGTSKPGLNSESGGSDRLYDELVSSLQGGEIPLKIETKEENFEDKAAALAQLLKLERDAKRRRISYKNRVHTKNKSHTEVLREVLEEQMLTIIGGETSNNGTCSNNTLRSDTERTSELIAMRPLQGNPHMAWLEVLKDEKSKKYNQNKLEAYSSSYYKEHRRRSTSVYKDHKEKKDWKKKGESDDRYRDKDKRKKSEYEDGGKERGHSPRHEEVRHKKKKRKRSSSSPRDGYRKHKSKHKKKKH